MSEIWNLELLASGAYSLTIGSLGWAAAFIVGALLSAWIIHFLAHRWLNKRWDLSEGLDKQVLGAIRGFILLIGVYLAFDQLGANTVNLGQIQGATITLGGIFVTGVIMWLAWSGAAVAGALVKDWLDHYEQINRSITSLMVNLTRALILFIGFYVAFSSLGFDLNVLLLPLSAVGLGLGFGLQRITENFASGLILLVERPVRDGDVIAISGVTGSVESIGLRATMIRKFDGTQVVMPNSELITRQLNNWTLSDTVVRADTTIGVAYGSDPEQVMEILLEEVHAHPDAMDEPGPRVFFTGYGDSALDFRVMFWVEAPGKRLTTLTALLTAWYHRFAAAGIEIPFPQRDLHIRSGQLTANGSNGNGQAETE